MVFLRILELVFSALIILFFLTQVVAPLLRGTPFFPFFRLQSKQLAKELELAREEVGAERMKREIGATKREAEFLRWEQKVQQKPDAEEKKASTTAETYKTEGDTK